ncbi:hypothetical protein QNL30_25215 [Pseudomonas amygdali pv. morsprunorum]|uniref:Mobilization protein n=1 Tax=Pseudomonas amygdali pv. morsprunorum TaxID=129138 RepID=A0AB35R993_PSEA0|nr:hypothetical protein [Pseudomonas amygdali]MDT3243886.1 hypothetical protein [Pseudomonas amygdali pv. morsprunorum]
MADLDELKRKRDQLTARIQASEARLKESATKSEHRVRYLVGSAVLSQLLHNPSKQTELLGMMDSFLTRPGERMAVLGEDGRGSEAFKRLVE